MFNKVSNFSESEFCAQHWCLVYVSLNISEDLVLLNKGLIKISYINVGGSAVYIGLTELSGGDNIKENKY